MAFHSTRECVDALERAGQLVRIEHEVDPHLEAAEIQRRVYLAGGPALLFARVKGSRFAMASNLFGTMQRAELLFADALERVRRLVELKVDPSTLLKRPWRYLGVPFTALTMLPRSVSDGPALRHTCRLSELPQMQSWPDDGGPFITLPQVYTEDPDDPSALRSNLGMYRVQLAGNHYERDREVGLHYQLHRGIGVHHQAAIRKQQPLRVSVFVGGPPAMTLAAVMPLPEGLPELAFAGALARRGVRLARPNGKGGAVVHADADFCLVGTVEPGAALKPEGPFGDHLGYYSLQHDFPVLRVEQVYHRADAIWPFTVVGRPPQEDTVFGELIHALTGPVIPTVLPGVRAVHAVDASGVHPLLLAIGSERYVPYRARSEPEELLTQANAILGQGQMSLAKVLLICAHEDAPTLDIHDIAGFFAHVLARADFRRDLHFQTRTTMDTLDYSGSGLNRGSKVVLAAVGQPEHALATALPSGLRVPDGFSDPRVCLPGVLALRAPAWRADDLRRFCAELSPEHPINAFRCIVLVDDAEFTARTLNNFLWVTFTRMNPAVDIDGLGAFTEHKHWGCTGALVIDARRKPHHAPPLIEDPAVTRRIDELARTGGPLAGLW
ncbi:MAG: 4-hydroxybenzoate decarboxylase subunit [Myxococcaceae bacterium]|nr:4-hydroxybenzoate decarboxylase subunit [Myxococcaceae bacterium]